MPSSCQIGVSINSNSLPFLLICCCLWSFFISTWTSKSLISKILVSKRFFGFLKNRCFLKHFFSLMQKQIPIVLYFGFGSFTLRDFFARIYETTGTIVRNYICFFAVMLFMQYSNFCLRPSCKSSNYQHLVKTF